MILNQIGCGNVVLIIFVLYESGFKFNKDLLVCADLFVGFNAMV